MDPVVVVVACAAALIAVERLQPGIEQPTVRGWWVRVGILNLAQAAITYIGVASWDRWLPRWSLWDGERFGLSAGVLLGYLAITFVYYWWHRARHEIPSLWRWLHQVHHSPVRIEVVTSFYKHPLEMALNSFLSSFVLHVLVGLRPPTAALVVTITGIAELVYHCNVRTPYWLGFFFQRPESHRRHHERSHHTSNFSDLPLWDIAFGTFDNPREIPRQCGFGQEREKQLQRMLCGRRPK